MASAVAQPLETPVRADSRRQPDDLDQHAGLDRDHHAVRPRPQHRRRGERRQAAINAAGGQLPKNLPSPPTYRKVNPADSPILLLAATSDTLPLTEVDDYVETKLAQQISQISGVAQVRRRRPAEAGGPHPARSGQAGRQGPVARGRAQAAVDRHRRQPKGTIDGPNAGLHDLRQRPAHRGRAVERRDRRLPQRRRRSGCATSARRSPARRTPSRRPGRDGKRGVFLVIFKQPGANVIDTVDRITGGAAAA